MKAKFDQIEAFIMVAKYGHFTKAAEKLSLTPAAISKKINELEKQLEIKLLHRTTRLCELTPIGQEYFQQWVAILNEISQTEAFITHLKAIPHGKLYVLTTQKEYLVPFLPAFCEKYPEINLKIEIAQRIPHFSKEKIDVVLGASFEPPEDVVRKKIGKTHYVLVGSPTYFNQKGLPYTPQDLSGHAYIEQFHRPNPGWVPFDNGQKIYCPPTLWMNHTSAMVECAVLGLGITRVHEYVAQNEIRNKTLVSVLRPSLQEEIPLYIYYPYSRYVDPKIRCFIDFITPKLKNLDKTVNN